MVHIWSFMFWDYLRMLSFPYGLRKITSSVFRLEHRCKIQVYDKAEHFSFLFLLPDRVGIDCIIKPQDVET